MQRWSKFTVPAPRAIAIALGVFCLRAGHPHNAAAQTVAAPAPTASSSRFGTPVVTRYRVGAIIVARGGSVQNIRAMVAVPLECPEQQVQVLEEDYSPLVENVEFRQTDEGVTQMLISIPALSPREEAQATVTYEVSTSPVLPPLDTASLRIPAKPDHKLKRYLGRSPYVDTNNRKIRAAVREALAAAERPKKEKVAADAGDSPSAGDADADESGADATGAQAALTDATQGSAGAATHSAPAEAEPAVAALPEPLTDWRRVEALYDYAIEHVKYEEGVDKSSVQTLAEGRGDCQAIAALFVAMCRTAKIPARLVWVDAHQYAEFYLEDAAGVGQWHPVESAGARAFGEMPTPRVILQKGDNFRVPERRRERLRYASDYALFLSKPGRQPKIVYVREQL